jgi:hypothetical protein
LREGLSQIVKSEAASWPQLNPSDAKAPKAKPREDLAAVAGLFQSEAVCKQ